VPLDYLFHRTEARPLGWPPGDEPRCRTIQSAKNGDTKRCKCVELASGEIFYGTCATYKTAKGCSMDSLPVGKIMVFGLGG
jgi:hypothetical protein